MSICFAIFMKLYILLALDLTIGLTLYSKVVKRHCLFYFRQIIVKGNIRRAPRTKRIRIYCGYFIDFVENLIPYRFNVLQVTMKLV